MAFSNSSVGKILSYNDHCKLSNLLRYDLSSCELAMERIKEKIDDLSKDIMFLKDVRFQIKENTSAKDIRDCVCYDDYMKLVNEFKVDKDFTDPKNIVSEINFKLKNINNSLLFLTSMGQKLLFHKDGVKVS